MPYAQKPEIQDLPGQFHDALSKKILETEMKKTKPLTNTLDGVVD